MRKAWSSLKYDFLSLVDQLFSRQRIVLLDIILITDVLNRNWKCIRVYLAYIVCIELLSIIMWLMNFNTHICLLLCMYSQKVKTYIAYKGVVNVESVFDTHFQIALNT